MSPDSLNPEFRVGTLHPKTFGFEEFCRANDFRSNPDIFTPAIFCVCGRTKIADLVMESLESRSSSSLLGVAT